jgi:hypothetical protein
MRKSVHISLHDGCRKATVNKGNTTSCLSLLNLGWVLVEEQREQFVFQRF